VSFSISVRPNAELSADRSIINWSRSSHNPFERML
jgi:hypothetical protein